MIFQHTLTNVLLENKTQTRRIIKDDEVAIRRKYNQIESVIKNGRTKWMVGQSYSVQPARGRSEVARIQLIKINSEKVKRISSNAAIAEGFADRQEFLNTWIKIHSKEALEQRVWVLTFKLISYTNVTKHSVPQDYTKIIAYATQRPYYFRQSVS